MSEKLFHTIAGAFFLVGGTLHALRLWYGWNMVVGAWVVPVWLSIAGVIFAYFLAYTAIKNS